MAQVMFSRLNMQERNESLFYYVLANNIEELLPIVHMPTVSLYCQKYGLMFKALPRSLFISIRDKGAGLICPCPLPARMQVFAVNSCPLRRLCLSPARDAK